MNKQTKKLIGVGLCAAVLAGVVVMAGGEKHVIAKQLIMANTVSAPSATQADDAMHAGWDAILKVGIKGQFVDYKVIAGQHAGELGAYLDLLAGVDVGGLSRDAQLAYYTNLYNATMVAAVIEKRAADAKWRPDSNGFGVFKEPRVKLKDKVVSLDELEHKIIRPTFKEPRVHVALVCAAVSCPPLVNKAYTAENLEATLAENLKRFVSDTGRNQIDTKKKVAKLSRLFDWFADDFGGKANVPAYFSKASGIDISGYKIDYVEYDWALNELK